MSSTIESTSAAHALRERFYDINALDSAGAIFDWDQQCLTPPAGAEARSHHTSILGRIAHEKLVEDETARVRREDREGDRLRQ